jgi:hypothetical protein
MIQLAAVVGRGKFLLVFEAYSAKSALQIRISNVKIHTLRNLGIKEFRD